MRYFIYRMDCHASGKGYIGVTTDLRRRIAAHRAKNKLPLDEGYNVYLLACCWDKSSAGQVEAAMILQHGTIHPDGHNEVYGGFEARQYPQAVRQKIAEAARGRPSAWVGRKHSEKTKALMSAQRRALAAEGKWGGKKGWVMSDEQRAKISAAKKGTPSPTKGVPRTEKDKAAMAAGRQRAKDARERAPLSEAQKARLRTLRKGAKMTEEQRLNIRNGMTFEQRSAVAKQRWVDRRARQAENRGNLEE